MAVEVLQYLKKMKSDKLYKVYKCLNFKIGKTKGNAWKVVFTPKKGDSKYHDDMQWAQCVDYAREHEGLNTSWNKLSDNSYTQCPECKHIFDHTKEEANMFEGVEIIEPKNKK